ncbi:MAG: carboxypeptidase regulatory-like domain-containing protein, partial [Candidatus Omnitrophica bacterium]|nr:carboxypeptidase regulatory-like domain-containing protein [Candidatus Omnitrophota bacterium]
MGSRILNSHRRLRRTLRQSEPAPASVCEVAARMTKTLGVQREIQVRVSQTIESPLLAGVRRPTILIPKRMIAPEYLEELPAVFAHELAHVQSKDLFWIGIAQWVQSALWFHPLIWRMKTALVAACEEVCDAVAAEQVGCRETYSKTLARMALDLAGKPVSADGLPFARSPEVMRRLDILASRFFPGRLKRKKVFAVLAFACLFAVPLGVTQFVQAEEKADLAKVEATKKSIGEKDAKSESELEGEKELTYGRMSGRVTDIKGDPVESCEVIFVPFATCADTNRAYWAFANRGRYRFDEPYTVTNSKGEFLSPELPTGSYYVNFSAEEYGRVQRDSRDKVKEGKTTEGIDQVLQPEMLLEGTVRSESGPVEGATVTAWLIPYKRMENGVIPAYYTRFTSFTDASGKFLLDRLQPHTEDENYEIEVEHPNFETVSIEELQPRSTDPLEIVLPQGQGMSGTVMDASSGEVVANATVDAYLDMEFYKSAQSNEDGSFEIRGLPEGEYHFLARKGEKVTKLSSEYERTLSPDTEAKPLELKLLEGGTFELIVVDDITGKPVSDAEVEGFA